MLCPQNIKEWERSIGMRNQLHNQFTYHRIQNIQIVSNCVKLCQWYFHQDNTPVYNSILVTDYLTKMGIKTVPQPPNSPDLAPCDFWLFPKLRGCRYETIEEMKEAVTKAIDTLTQEDFHGAS